MQPSICLYHQCRTLQQHLLRASDLLDLSGTKNVHIRFNEHSRCRIHFQVLGTKDRVTFPPHAQGFLYFHHKRGTPLSSGEIRFRVFKPTDLPHPDAATDNPVDFSRGSDLISPRHEPWSLSLFRLTKRTLEPFKRLLLSEGLVDETLMSTIAKGMASEAARKTLHYLEQPFVVDMSKTSQSFGIWDGQKMTVSVVNWFRDWRTKPVVNPYAGHLLVRFEQLHREREYDLRAHDDKNEDNRVGERVAVRILKIIEPLRVTNPEYDMHLPVPREGELLPSRMKKAELLINLDKGALKALKGLTSVKPPPDPLAT